MLEYKGHEDYTRGRKMTFPIDLHDFFDQGRADVIMHRELVQTSDIDGERFVTVGIPDKMDEDGQIFGRARL